MKKFFNNVYKYSWKSLITITARLELMPSIELSRVLNVEYGNINAKIFVFLK